jgi:phthiodiolone/phenolphthiodiolone dimycocerosates ketoreductase
MTVEVAWLVETHRSVPPQAVAEMVKGLEASGVIDDFWTFDQLSSWLPRAIWTPDVVPGAAYVSDPDSYADPFITAAFISAATRLGVAVSTDAIRRGPAELMQAMITLASATEGKAKLLLGAGEVKQCAPFGYRRSEGLARLEDVFRLARLLLEADEPFDFDGTFWQYRQAWIGGAVPHRPRLLALGAGPKLIDLALRYGDGIVAACPHGFTSPEAWGAEVERCKAELDRLGRDPDAFTFGFVCVGAFHDDQAVLEGVLDNELVRYMAALFGRLQMADWAAAGFDPPMPFGWHYAIKLLPLVMTPEDVREITTRVSSEMAKAGLVVGTPAEAAKTLRPYIDAGATWVAPFNLTALVLPVEEAAAAMESTLELCRLLKSTT